MEAHRTYNDRYSGVKSYVIMSLVTYPHLMQAELLLLLFLFSMLPLSVRAMYGAAMCEVVTMVEK